MRFISKILDFTAHLNQILLLYSIVWTSVENKFYMLYNLKGIFSFSFQQSSKLLRVKVGIVCDHLFINVAFYGNHVFLIANILIVLQWVSDF